MADSDSLQVFQRDGVTVVALGREYDNLFENMLADLEKPFLEVGRTADPPRVVIDLPHARFAGSAILGLLLRVSERLKARDGGRFAVSSLTPYVASVLKLTQLEQMIEVFETQDAAVEALSGA